MFELRLDYLPVKILNMIYKKKKKNGPLVIQRVMRHRMTSLSQFSDILVVFCEGSK